MKRSTFPVRLGTVRPDVPVLDCACERLVEHARPIARAVIGHHCGDRHAQALERTRWRGSRIPLRSDCVRRQRSLSTPPGNSRQQRGGGSGSRVSLPLLLERLGFSPQACCAALAKASAVDTPTAAVSDASELLDVHMNQITQIGPLIAHRQPASPVHVHQEGHTVAL